MIQSKCAVFTVDCDGLIVLVDGLAQVWGYPSADFCGRRFLEFVHLPDQASVQAEIERIMAAGSAGEFECLMRQADGQLMELTWTVLLNGKGNPARYIGQDLSDLRTMEKRLAGSEKRIRSILGSLPAGLLIVSTQGMVQAMNPAAEQMFGYQSIELANQHLLTLLKARAGQTAESLMLFISKQVGHTCNLQLSKKSGVSFPADVLLQEFEVLEGHHYIIIIIDVTERYELEKVKQEFVAIVSHELRTPLTSVHGVLTMLHRDVYGPLNDVAKSKALKASQQVTRVMELINNFLDLEKIEAGKFDFLFEKIAVDSLIQNSIAAIEQIAEEHLVSLKLDCLQNLYALADQERITQVLINLFSNALKYSRQADSIEVTVKDLGTLIEVRVTDQGPGVAPEFRQIIFEKYHQIRDSKGTQKKGTGLGLPICKTIVEEHGGSIGVDGELGHGSSFWFRLPKFKEPQV